MPRFSQPLTSATAPAIAGTGKYFGRLSNTFLSDRREQPVGELSILEQPLRRAS